MYLLDTSICVPILRGRHFEGILSKLRDLDPSQVFLCSVVVAELAVGIEKSARRLSALGPFAALREEFVSIPFEDAAADAYGRIRAELEIRGCVIGSNDMMIAAIAHANDLTLVTRDATDFTRVPGLKFEIWS